MHLEDFEKGNPWTTVPNSVNIEMTGFALLSMLNREDSKFEESIPVVNWMLEQQNARGGISKFLSQALLAPPYGSQLRSMALMIDICFILNMPQVIIEKSCQQKCLD